MSRLSKQVMRHDKLKRLAYVVSYSNHATYFSLKKIAQEITMSTLELKANDTVTTHTSNVKSHDFTIIWSYAIAALAVLLVVIYGTTATQLGSSVDFASLSIPL